jgi:hypothetical protein
MGRVRMGRGSYSCKSSASTPSVTSNARATGTSPSLDEGAGGGDMSYEAQSVACGQAARSSPGDAHRISRVDPGWTHQQRGLRRTRRSMRDEDCPHRARQRKARRQHRDDRSRCRLVVSESRTEDDEVSSSSHLRSRPGARADGHPPAGAVLATSRRSSSTSRPSGRSARPQARVVRSGTRQRWPRRDDEHVPSTSVTTLTG